VPLVVVLVPLVALSALVRLLTAPLVRRRSPDAAVLVERYWVWLPLVLMFTLLLALAWPLAVLLGVAAAIVMAVQPSVFGMRRRRSLRSPVGDRADETEVAEA